MCRSDYDDYIRKIISKKSPYAKPIQNIPGHSLRGQSLLVSKGVAPLKAKTKNGMRFYSKGYYDSETIAKILNDQFCLPQRGV